jgi:hypothetical protein
MIRSKIHTDFFLFPWCSSPLWARAKSLSSLHYHTETHHIRYASSARAVRRRDFYLTPHDTRKGQTSISLRKFEPAIPSKPAACADPRLRPRGYWNIHTEHSWILGATVKDLVSRATWRLRPCIPGLLWLSHWHYWECSTTESNSSVARMEKSWMHVVSICRSAYVDKRSFNLSLPM